MTKAPRQIDWLCARPIAHRGLHNVAEGVIENTPSAFSAALKHGYAIECDLQLSVDGEAMVFHDFKLGRLTTKTGLVTTHTVKDLQKIAFKNSSDHMQTLAELLNQISAQCGLLIELKSDWSGNLALAERAVEVLATYNGPHAVMSFDPDLVERVAHLAPDMARGLVADNFNHPDYDGYPLARRKSLQQMDHLSCSKPQFLSYNVNELPSDASRDFIARDLPVICWTVKSAEKAKQALNHCQQITFEGFLP